MHNFKIFSKLCASPNQRAILKIFRTFNPEIVVNLAAQAGVRYSLKNPKEYINSKNEEKSKVDAQISTSSNESRPGTLFKMCSRS